MYCTNRNIVKFFIGVFLSYVPVLYLLKKEYHTKVNVRSILWCIFSKKKELIIVNNIYCFCTGTRYHVRWDTFLKYYITVLFIFVSNNNYNYSFFTLFCRFSFPAERDDFQKKRTTKAKNMTHNASLYKTVHTSG